MKLRRDDTVIVTKGKDRGRTGKIQQVFPKHNMVLVEGINRVTKHIKPSSGVRQGGIIQKEMPVKLSNIQLICPNCDKPSRIGYQFLSDSTKARFCKKCQETIE